MTNRSSALLSAIVYVIFCIILFPYLYYYVDNCDSFSYITIAEKYARGDFSEALNGHWSPLISWLLAIPVKFHVDAILAFKILQLLLGLFALLQWTLLIEKFIKNKLFRLLLSLAAVPFLLSYALRVLTPDLLLMTMVILYLNMVCDPTFFQKRNFGIIAGAVGVLLYLSKSFGFLFFITHFSLLLLYRIFTSQDVIFKKHVAKNYIIALLFFLLGSGAWIAMISSKYHHFTISETVGFNLSDKVAPTLKGNSEAPVYNAFVYELHPPVNTTAISIWEDPSFAVKATALKPWSSSADFHRYEKVLLRNFLSIYYYDFRRQTGCLFLIVMLFFFFSRERKRLLNFSFLAVLLTVVLFYGMYCLILVHPRYIWVCTFLMILMIAYLLDSDDAPYKRLHLSAGIRTGILFFILLFAMKRPLKEIFFINDTDSSLRQLATTTVHPFHQLNETYRQDKNCFVAVDSLKKIFSAGERIASFEDKFASRDDYGITSFIAYETGTKYFGQVKYQNFAQLEDSLSYYKISYMLLWYSDSLHEDIRNPWKKIYSNEGASLRVFKSPIN